jgi:hypothetical protein
MLACAFVLCADFPPNEALEEKMAGRKLAKIQNTACGCGENGGKLFAKMAGAMPHHCMHASTTMTMLTVPMLS